MPISFAVALQDVHGRKIPIGEYRIPQRIVLAGEADSWPRSVVFALKGADPNTEFRVQHFLEQQPGRAFTFTAMRAGDALRLVGEAPDGAYTLRVMIQDLKLEQERLPLTIRRDYSDTVVATVLADTCALRPTGPLDPQIEHVLRASTLEGENGLEWLADTTQRASRRACLQNILAKLRSAPSADDPLLPLIKNIFLAAPDRIYATVDQRLHTRVQQLVASGEWSHEGRPQSPCHLQLLEEAAGRGLISPGSAYSLDSFRQETVPSLQIVVAVPPQIAAPYYADIDIDLANPFMDLRGLVVHAGEVAIGDTTDQLTVRTLLEGDPSVVPFLAYRVVNADEVAG